MLYTEEWKIDWLLFINTFHPKLNFSIDLPISGCILLKYILRHEPNNKSQCLKKWEFRNCNIDMSLFLLNRR